MFLGGALVGFAGYGPTDEPTTWKLHKLYLLPAQHGRGLGSRLLQHCETTTRPFGANHLTLNVNKRNARAIAVYQRNGYTIADSVSLAIGDEFVMDDFVMTKRLA